MWARKCYGLSPSFSICLWLGELALLEKLSFPLGVSTCPTCKVRIGVAYHSLIGIPRSYSITVCVSAPHLSAKGEKDCYLQPVARLSKKSVLQKHLLVELRG